MVELAEQLVQKLGLEDDKKILGKTKELLRLLELRSTNIDATLNSYAKMILCIDLAASMLSTPFDQVTALKLSGLRKIQYVNNKRMFEKLLDIGKEFGVSDICVKLGMNEVTEKAKSLLEMYKSACEKDGLDIDIAHPQYSAMAVFQACKMIKKRVLKTKILTISHLRPTQWVQLEQHWDKVTAKYNLEKKSNTLKEEISEKSKMDDPTVQATKRNTLEEDYETWKCRMLALAKQELAALTEETSGDKENRSADRRDKRARVH